MGRDSKLTAALMAAALVVAALMLSACGSDSSDTTGGGETGNAEATVEEGGTEEAAGGDEGGKLGLLMDVTRNDKSFGQATYEGAKAAAEELGLELTVVDDLASDPQKAQSALLNMAKESDYVINGAIPLMGGLPRVAEQNPDTQFAAYAVSIPSSDNLHWAFQDWYPLGYLAGIAAAESTKSDVVGFVGGDQIPPTISGEAGFNDGVKAVDPKVKVLSTITGSFEDSAKAQQAASAQAAQGADVIYSFLDAGHLGAVEAAEEAGGVKLIGVISPKCDVSKGLEIGDTTARPDEMVRELVVKMASGEIEDTEYGVQNEEIAGFGFCPGGSTPAVEKAVEEARQEFTEGALTTPSEFKASEAE